MIKPALERRMRQLYCETGNLAAVIRAMKGKVSEGTIKDRYAKNKEEWEQAKKDYLETLAEKHMELEMSILKMPGWVRKMITKMERLIEKTSDGQELSQLGYSLTGLSKELRTLQDRQRLDIDFENLKTDSILAFMMGNKKTKKVLMEVKDELTKHVKQRVKDGT